MAKIILTIVTLLTFSFSKKLDNYSFIFRYNNYSLGPIEGNLKARIYIKNSKFYKLYDINRAREFKSYKNYPEVKYILNVLKGKTKGYRVKYNSYHLPIKIIPNRDISIDLSSYSFSKYIYNNSLLTQHKIAYRKFKNLNLKNYKFTYQVADKTGVKYGIEVFVKHDKIVLARDSNTLRKLNIKTILTLNKIFKIAKYNIEHKRVKEIRFDEKYHFVKYLNYQIGNNYKTLLVFNFNEL